MWRWRPAGAFQTRGRRGIEYRDSGSRVRYTPGQSVEVLTMPLLVISDLFTRTSYTFDEAIDTIMGDLGLRENTIITSGDCGTWLNRAQNILARDSKSFCVQLTI